MNGSYVLQPWQGTDLFMKAYNQPDCSLSSRISYFILVIH